MVACAPLRTAGELPPATAPRTHRVDCRRKIADRCLQHAETVEAAEVRAIGRDLATKALRRDDEVVSAELQANGQTMPQTPNIVF